MRKSVSVLELDSLVRYMTEEERKGVAEAVADGSWSVEMDSDRYDNLWCMSVIDVKMSATAEDAMRNAVRIPGRKNTAKP